MNLLLYFLLPGILITLFHLFCKYLLEEKITIKDTLFYYIKSSIIINIFMILIMYIKYDRWLMDIIKERNVLLKYVLCGSFFGLFIPYLLYKLKHNVVTKINAKYEILKVDYKKENIKKYFEDNKSSKYKLLFFIGSILFFFIIDFFLRRLSSQTANFHSEYILAPNIITLTFATIFTYLIYYLPKKTSKVLYFFLTIFNFVLFIAQYYFLKIKIDALSIYDLNDAGEGAAFLNVLRDKTSLKFILLVVFSIALIVFNFIILKKIKEETIKFSKGKIFKLIVIAFLGFTLGNISLRDYQMGEWQSITYPRYYYNNYVSPKKSLTSLGLYEYTLRDIRLYIESKTSKFGSVEEIKELIDKYSISYKTNEYSGIFKDKNVIMIMLESIDYVVLNEETMPTLYHMYQNGWTFPNRFSALATGGSTIATEYTSMTSLFHSNRYYKELNTNYYPYSLPNMFIENGYKTMSVHENNGIYYNRDELHKNLGFQNSYFLYDILDNPEYYIDAQIATNDEIYNKIVSKDEKFLSFIITIAAHGPYDDTNGHCARANKADTQKDCFSYLSKRTDDLLTELTRRLKEDNLLDDTIIILYTDHPAYLYDYSEEELKLFKQVDEQWKIKTIPFIIYNPSIKHKSFDNILVNDIDIVPTILNLFGIKYDPNDYVGVDLFSEDHKNLIIFSDMSWYDGNVYSDDKNIDKNKEEYKEYFEFAKDKINLSHMILSNNYYQENKK